MGGTSLSELAVSTSVLGPRLLRCAVQPVDCRRQREAELQLWGPVSLGPHRCSWTFQNSLRVHGGFSGSAGGPCSLGLPRPRSCWAFLSLCWQRVTLGEDWGQAVWRCMCLWVALCLQQDLEPEV